MNIRSMEDLDVSGKRVLVRVDFNVPLSDTGTITDDTRIRAALPTIQHLLKRDAKVILLSHLGRPKGQVNAALSLAPVAERLSQLLDTSVTMAKDIVGEHAHQSINHIHAGEIVLLENLRFDPGEEQDDQNFVRALAKHGEVYVNDAFGTCHRAHASVTGIPALLPAAAGFLVQKEVAHLSNIIDHPTKPFAAILGGSKVSDKIVIIEKLLEKVSTILIGGGMAYTFLKAQGHTVGTSIVEEEKVDFAAQLLERAPAKDVQILLPIDHIVADAFSIDSQIQTTDIDIPEGWMGLDIGPRTKTLFTDTIKLMKTVLWNGPVGVFEMAPFAKGTQAVAHTLAEQCRQGLADVIVGGGDTAAAAAQCGVSDALTHVSTGGGASLEMLEGKVLPGIHILLVEQHKE